LQHHANDKSLQRQQMTKLHRLCHTDEIPAEGSKGFAVGNTALFAVKKTGRIFLYRNRCPHVGIALEWVEDQFLDVSKTLIQCANHGAQFDIVTGECVAGPCVGQALSPVSFIIEDDYLFITGLNIGAAV
jgi:nitrite reductase/ring-hydroxylating ferredoxin subunit